MAAVYAEDLKKPLKPIKPKVRPGSGSIKVEVLVGSMTKSEVADAIKKGRNPMKFKDAAKKKKTTTNKKGKPMSFSGNSKGGMPKKKGYAKGGKMNDMRKTGMFYGGMSRRGK